MEADFGRRGGGRWFWGKEGVGEMGGRGGAHDGELRWEMGWGAGWRGDCWLLWALWLEESVVCYCVWYMECESQSADRHQQNPSDPLGASICTMIDHSERRRHAHEQRESIASRRKEYF